MSKPAELVVGVDASRNRSGGARAHLIGILTEGEPAKHGIGKIHLWAYRSLLDAVPDRPWLIKHNPGELERSLPRQLWWQRFRFQDEAKKAGCAIVLNTDAGTVSTFHPSVTMSRDMLSYEPGAIERYGFSKARLRLILLRHVQNHSLSRAAGAVFLTRYAAGVIQKSCGPLPRVAYIPHGVGKDFRKTRAALTWPEKKDRPIRCLYVSNAAMYKHQWVVVQAIEALRKRGHDLTLTLVGGGNGRAQRLLEEQMAISDPEHIFVQQVDFVPQQELPKYLANADVFIFASSCENMPNTLVEAMTVGLPIACSNRGPMPEVLCDGGVYFDPENAVSIAEAVESVINDASLRSTLARRARELSQQYSWSRCADETWNFIVATYNSIKWNGG